MTTEERRRRRFSESFRKEQVKLIESNQLTILEVSRLYEVKTDSVRRWVKKYGVKTYPSQIIISSPKEIDKLKEIKKENQQLKEIIADQQIKIIYYDKLMDFVKEKLGDDFEKKC